MITSIDSIIVFIQFVIKFIIIVFRFIIPVPRRWSSLINKSALNLLCIFKNWNVLLQKGRLVCIDISLSKIKYLLLSLWWIRTYFLYVIQISSDLISITPAIWRSLGYNSFCAVMVHFSFQIVLGFQDVVSVIWKSIFSIFLTRPAWHRRSSL